MKKIAIIVGTALCFVALMVLVIKANRPATLFDANVEALSRSEISFGRMCSQTGTLGNRWMPLCSRCSGLCDYYALDAVAFCRN